MSICAPACSEDVNSGPGTCYSCPGAELFRLFEELKRRYDAPTCSERLNNSEKHCWFELDWIRARRGNTRTRLTGTATGEKLSESP